MYFYRTLIKLSLLVDYCQIEIDQY